jgi:hypothetical protein
MCSANGSFINQLGQNGSDSVCAVISREAYRFSSCHFVDCKRLVVATSAARTYANLLPQSRHTSYVQPEMVNGRLRLRCQQPKRNSKARCSFSVTMGYQQFACRSFRRIFPCPLDLLTLWERFLSQLLLENLPPVGGCLGIELGFRSSEVVAVDGQT